MVETRGTRRRKKVTVDDEGVSSSADEGADPVIDAQNKLLQEKKEAEKKWNKIFMRSFVGLLMLLFLYMIVYFGHVCLTACVIIVQVVLFKELTRVRYEETQAKNVPMFRTIIWMWFCVAMFYSYGPLVYRSLPTSYNSLEHYHNWMSFSAYVFTFLLSVLALKRDSYRYQMGQLSWTMLTTAMVVFQTQSITANINSGIFWFLLPSALIITNDTMAYYVGAVCGRKLIKIPFLSLSPNKTWEGFIGGGLCTMVLAYYLPLFLIDDWFVCPLPKHQFYVMRESFKCEYNPVFIEQNFILPSSLPLIGGYAWKMLPIQAHAVLLGSFASLVAPFGGFFASAIKRAYSIKDFDSIFPGHGGFMDRMDCQLLMGLCTRVHYQSFIIQSTTALLVAIEAFKELSNEDKAEAFVQIQKEMA